jgi:hypothetical protein
MVHGEVAKKPFADAEKRRYLAMTRAKSKKTQQEKLYQL